MGKALVAGIVADDTVVSTALTQRAPSMQSILDDNVTEVRQQQAHQSRRLSARDFFDKQISVGDMELQLAEEEVWEMVLVNGEHEESQSNTGSTLRQQDIVFNGHEDG